MPPSSSGCLSREGEGLQLASSVQSFVLCPGLGCHRALRVVAIPQSGLLAQVSSFRLRLEHSGQILTLSNAAHASLPSPCLLVLGAGVSVLLLHWGSYHWARNLWGLIIYLFFLPVMLPSVLPVLATDSAVRVFPGVWKLRCFFKTPFPGRSSVPTSFVFYIFSYPLSKTMRAFLSA